MVSNRRLFDRFEKSDNWLPFLALAVICSLATIAVVTLAGNLSSQSLDRGKASLLLIGRTLGIVSLHDPKLTELQGDDVPASVIERLEQGDIWNENFRFLSAYDWTDQSDYAKLMLNVSGLGNGLETEPAVPAENRMLALCWGSDDDLSLLVLIVSRLETQELQIASEDIVSASILSMAQAPNQLHAEEPEAASIVDGDSLPSAPAQQLLITAARYNDVSAPWQSVVSLDKSPKDLAKDELITAHREHIADKTLLPIPTENVGEWVQQQEERERNWLIDRGGLTTEDVDRLLSDLPSLNSLEPGRVRTLIHLGYQTGFSQSVSLQALQLAAATTDAIDAPLMNAEGRQDTGVDSDSEALVVVHPCSHPIDLLAQLSQLPLEQQLVYVPSDLDSDVEAALSDGAQLPSKAKTLISDIAIHGTLVHDMTEPFHAKFYRIKPRSIEPRK